MKKLPEITKVARKKVKYLNIKDFRENGYLQELNRRFLHPLGLALEIEINHDGTEILKGIWDYRKDQEGNVFINLTDKKSLEKFKKVEKEWKIKEKTRKKKLGFMIQPIGSKL